MPSAQLITVDDLVSFSADHPHRDLMHRWTEGEDGPVRPADWVDPEADEVPPWTMTMEADEGRSDHQGEKDDLIRIAREAGVPDENITIYDRAASTYLPLA